MRKKTYTTMDEVLAVVIIFYAALHAILAVLCLIDHNIDFAIYCAVNGAGAVFTFCYAFGKPKNRRTKRKAKRKR